VIIHERGKDREVFTTSGTYPWLFVTQIFHKGQPSSRSFPNTKFAKQTQLVRTDWRLDIQCFEIRKSNTFWTFIAIMGRATILNIFNIEWTYSYPRIIPVKCYFNQIKNIFWTFMVTMGRVESCNTIRPKYIFYWKNRNLHWILE
jgi:hypothetical protein